MKKAKFALENLLNSLATQDMPLNEFVAKFGAIDELNFDINDLDMWRALGLDIDKNEQGDIKLATKFRDIKEQEFCVVDIETSGGINSGQIIEIGAIKIKNGVEIGRFESLISAPFVPEIITDLTGISTFTLIGAPTLGATLERFKNFLGMSVFVAHNVNFDYGFISQSLENLGFGRLLNRKICTIDLSRRTIPSERYGLGSLKELLGIKNAHHRALSDAVAASEIFKFCLSKLPADVKTTEELIKFSKSAPSLKITPILEPV